MRPSISRAVRHVAAEVAAGTHLNLLPRLPAAGASRALDAESRPRRGTRQKMMLPLFLQLPETWLTKPPILTAHTFQQSQHQAVTIDAHAPEVGGSNIGPVGIVSFASRHSVRYPSVNVPTTTLSFLYPPPHLQHIQNDFSMPSVPHCNGSAHGRFEGRALSISTLADEVSLGTLGTEKLKRRIAMTVPTGASDPSPFLVMARSKLLSAAFRAVGLR